MRGLVRYQELQLSKYLGLQILQALEPGSEKKAVLLPE